MRVLRHPEMWLNAIHIDGAQKLLKKQFPQQAGLQCPHELAVNRKYDFRSGDDSIQIMNLNREHWVCCSNIWCSQGVVKLYNSAPTSTSHQLTDLQQQLAVILNTRNFEVDPVKVQCQVGNNDCGVFAIANAYSLCERLDPHLVTLDQPHMRKHLIKCFRDGYFTPFPR